MADARWMRRALALAAKGARTCMPNPRVGCVIVKDGQIVGEGWHRTAGAEHAEILALAQARDRARGAQMFVTLEPCSHVGSTPPCVDAIIAARPAQVQIAIEDPNPLVDGQGIKALRAAGIKVEVGLLAEQSSWLNRGFFRRMTARRPWVCVKSASSLDGRIALASGTSKWITGAAARRDVQRLRAQSCAIMTGSGTALADDPRLDARIPGARRQPLRVLVDGSGRCHAGLRMLKGQSLVACASEQAVRDDWRRAGITTQVLGDGGGKVDLGRLLDYLAGELQTNFLLVEAGAGLVGALIERGLVDQVVAYVAPTYIGPGIPVADLAAATSLESLPRFTLRKIARQGDDVKMDLVRRGCINGSAAS